MSFEQRRPIQWSALFGIHAWTVSITHNETTNPQRYDWQIVKRHKWADMRQLEWLAEYVALVAAEETELPTTRALINQPTRAALRSRPIHHTRGKDMKE